MMYCPLLRQRLRANQIRPQTTTNLHSEEVRLLDIGRRVTVAAESVHVVIRLDSPAQFLLVQRFDLEKPLRLDVLGNYLDNVRCHGRVRAIQFRRIRGFPGFFYESQMNTSSMDARIGRIDGL